MSMKEELPGLFAEYKVDEVGASLEAVQRDLQAAPLTREDSAQLELGLREVVKQCIAVQQDLNRGVEIETAQANAQRTATETRRYPQRRRSTLVDLVPDAVATVRNKSPTKKKSRAPPTRSKTNKAADELQIASERQETVDSHEASVKEEEGMGDECFAAADLEGPSDDHTQSPRISSPTVTLQDVIDSFNRCRSPEPCLSNYSPFLPPVSEGEPREAIQPRATQMHVGWRQEKDETSIQEEPSATKVYVMPSGYIVQSVQMVLEQRKAEEAQMRLPPLHPLFSPEPYSCESMSRVWVPVWQAPLEVSCRFLEMETRLEIDLLPPRMEVFQEDRLPNGIDVRSFLARMNGNWQGRDVMPLPSSPLASDQLDRSVHSLLTQFQKQILGIVDGHSTNERKELSPETNFTPGTLEKRLEDFSHRLKHFYEPSAESYSSLK